MFKFKGISSIDMEVVIEEEELFIAKAEQRYDITEIDGRNGAIFEPLGYSYINRPIYVQCLNTSKIDLILAWLDGEGEFEYKGRKTIARFYSSLEPQRSACIRIIDTTFIRNPFWNKINDDFIEIKDLAYNAGNIYSEPIIRLEKIDSENVDISVGNIRFQYDFNNEEYVEIDCENKNVLYEGLNRNRQIKMGYDFPILSPGENNVVVHSGNVVIKIKKKDRWL